MSIVLVSLFGMATTRRIQGRLSRLQAAGAIQVFHRVRTAQRYRFCYAAVADALVVPSLLSALLPGASRVTNEDEW